MSRQGDISQNLIPRYIDLPSFLQIESCTPDYEGVFSKMIDPLTDALSVHGKKIRFEMVDLGFKCTGGTLSERTKNQLRICEQIIEGIHLGSMIIDDIQDQSEIRRGRATLHRKYGVSVALNVGNWLYFQAVNQIESLNLNSENEIKLRRSLNHILLKAHFGQGIDVGIDMNSLPKDLVESTYYTAAELKTGALMAFAFNLGAIIAQPSVEQPKGFSSFAKKFGIALQILDDIGNYLAPPPKGKEDLKLGRPSFTWVMAARLAEAADYERFKFATRRIPDTSFIDTWGGIHDLVAQSKKFASMYLKNLKEELIELVSDSSIIKLNNFSSDSFNELKLQIDAIFTKLEKAYE